MAYHLQLIGVPNGFYKTSLTLLVQEKRYPKNGQKFNFFDKKIFKNLFLKWFSWKVTLTIPPLFFNGRHFLSWARKVKSQPFWRKSQNSPKIVINHKIFQKFDFYHPGSVWLPKRAHLCPEFDPYSKKKFFLIKNEFFWPFFRKSRFLTPPTLVKVQEGEFQSKNAIRKKSFFCRFKAACKKLEKVTVTFARTCVLFSEGVYRQQD